MRTLLAILALVAPYNNLTTAKGNGGVTTMAAVGSTPSANGASISGVTLTLQPADATHPGVVTTGTQSFGGAKTVGGLLTASAALTVTSGDFTLHNGNIQIDTAGTIMNFGASNASTFKLRGWVDHLTIDDTSSARSFNVFKAGHAYSNATGLSAAANDAQSGCTALGFHELNVFSTVGAATNSTCLPTPTYVGQHTVIVNYGANTLHVFPTSTNTINGGSAGAEWLTGVAATAGGVLGQLECNATSVTDWACK